ncbi:ABC transporter substrate-binding protein, partial [Paraburkholderia sp. SIMBA_055]
PYSVLTSQTGVARMRVDHKIFGDPRVRKAMKLAVDHQKIIATSLLGAGVSAEDHHVAPVHPEYYALPKYGRDVVQAK